MMKHNFGAGPAILPKTVMAQASQAVLELDNSGLSLLEISHRSPAFMAIMDEAQARVRSLFDLGDDYEVLFLQGGASTQFAMIPYNLLPEGKTAAYLNTGAWASKALKEAAHFGTALEVASSNDANFNYIPKSYEVPSDVQYFHYTTNNTIYGTQMKSVPSVDVPLVADMSSDIFSRKIDAKKFDLIYAGAQKNLGPAGATLVVLNKRVLGSSNRKIPTMFDYRTHAEKGSMFNTPPCFPIYVSMLSMRWIEEQGGLDAIEALNTKKADKLYAEIDRNPLFKGSAAIEDRSFMNVTFVMDDKELESQFLAFATERDCIGLKGHRSVGGFRASIYNALEEVSIDHLVGLMKEFAEANG
jgi:phosphoserine aminotransferase